MNKYFNKLNNLKIKYKKNPNKLLLLLSVVCFAISLIVGGSYAYLTYVSKTGHTTTINAGTLALNLKSEANIINLDKVLPQEDKEAIEDNTPYTFTVENTGNIGETYIIKLDNTCVIGKTYRVNDDNKTVDMCIPNTYIRAAIKEGDGSYKTVKVDGNNEIVLTTGTLSSNEEKNYSLKIWLDWDTPNTYNDDTKNVVYSGKLSIDYEQGKKDLGNSYTVVFNANGGTGTMSNETFTAGQSKALTKNVFTKTGANFIGWSTTKTSKVAEYEDEQVVSNLSSSDQDKIILYAIWNEDEYVVTQNVINGTGEAQAGAAYGEDVKLKVEPNKNYHNPVVSCTNNQHGEINGKYLVVSNVTNNTTCIVTYEAMISNLTGDMVVLSNQTYTYDGQAKTPTVTVTVDGETLVQGENYTVTYSNNINAGTATVTVIGNGIYEGTVTKQFTINPYNLSNATIASISNQNYTGSAITPTPAVTVKLDGTTNTTLVKNTDFTYSYSDNTNVGESAKVTVTGKGNYTGTKTATFTINEVAATISCASTTPTYNGSVQTIATCSGGTISGASKTNAGSYTVTCTGDSNHSDASSKSCSINKKSITPTAYSATYNGTTSYSRTYSTGVGSETLSLTYKPYAKTATTYSYATTAASGKYTLTVADGTGDADNYTISSPGAFTINKKELVLGTYSANYNGTTTYTRSVTGVNSETVTVTYKPYAATAGSYDYATTVGSGKYTVTLSDSTNYTVGSASTFTINKVDATCPTTTAYSGTYDGSAHGITVSGGSGGTVKYRTSTTGTWSTTKPTITNVSDSPMTTYVEVEGDSNHNTVDCGSKTVTLSKKVDTVSLTAKSTTYTGSAISANTATAISGTTITYAYYSSTDCSGTALSGAPTNVGNYSVKATSAGNGNYSSGSKCVTHTITKGTPTVTLTDKSANYTGSAISANTATAKNPNGNSVTLSYTYTYYSDSSCSTTTSSHTNAGTYYVKATSAATDNLNSATSGCAKLTISKVDAVCPSITAYSGTYDGSAHGITVSGGSGGTVKYRTSTTGSWTTTKPTITNVSDSPMTTYVEVEGDSNHNTIDCGSKTVTIARKGISVPTCSDKTYNGTQQTLFASGTGYTAGGTTTGTNAGTYTATATPTGNYKWSSDDSTTAKNISCIINPYNLSNATIASISNQNYTGSAITPTPTVTVPIPSGSTTILVSGTDFTYSYSDNINIGSSAKVTVTAKTASNYTGTKTATFAINKIAATISCASTTPTYNGSVQTIATCSGGTISGASKTNAGSYTVTCTGDSNHSDASSKSCSINKKELVLGTYSANYNGTTTYTRSVAGVNSETVTVTYAPYAATAAAYSYATSAGSGKYTVTLSDSTNYTVGSASTFTINKVNATCPTTTAYSGTYDGSARGITVSGGSGGTIKYRTSTTGTWGTTKPTITNVSDSPMTTYVEVEGDSNHNTVDCGSKTVTIARKGIDVPICSDKTYNGAQQTLFTSGTGYTAGGTTTGTNAGTYTATATPTGNYKWSSDDSTTAKNISCKINPYNLSNATIASISAQNYTGSAIKPTPAVTVKLDGTTNTTLVNNSDFTYSYSDNTNAGESAKVTVTGKGNYTGTKTATFTINKVAATVTCSATTKTYNGATQGVTCTGSGTTSSSITPTYYTDSSCSTAVTTSTGASATGGAPIDAGQYYIKATGTADGNHSGTPASSCVSYKINTKGISSFTWNPSGTASYSYDGTPHVPTATASTGVTNETITLTTGSGNTNVGSYTATATCSSVSGGRAKCGNYSLSSNTKSYSITAVAATVTCSATTKTYNGATQGVTCTGSGTTSSSITPTYYTDSSCSTAVTTSTGASATGGAPIDAGQYYIKATGTADGNHSGTPASSCVSYKMNAKGISSFTWNPSGTASYSYDGTPHVPTATASTGVTNETITLTTGSGNTNPGSYTATATCSSVSGGRAKCANYSLSSNTKAYTIIQATQPMTVTTPQTWSTIFSTSAQTKTITAAANNQGTVTYSINSQKDSSSTTVTYFSISGTTLTATANTPTGTYTVVVRASAEGNTNYSAGTKDITVNVTISGITRTVTYEKGTGVNAIGKTSDSCTTSGTSTSCTVTAPTITSSTGYDTGKWGTSSTVQGNVAAGGTITLSSNATYYAIAVLNTYTVSVTAVNGTISGATQKDVNYGSTTTFSVSPSTGYSASNPIISCSGGTYSNPTFTTPTITGNTTCQITFNPIITFNANGGSGGPTTVVKTFGTPLTLPSSEPTSSSTAFLGWATSSTAGLSSSKTWYDPSGSFASDIPTTLYAQWYNISSLENDYTTFVRAEDLSHAAASSASHTFTGWDYYSYEVTPPANAIALSGYTTTTQNLSVYYYNWTGDPNTTAKLGVRSNYAASTSATKTITMDFITCAGRTATSYPNESVESRMTRLQNIRDVVTRDSDFKYYSPASQLFSIPSDDNLEKTYTTVESGYKLLGLASWFMEGNVGSQDYSYRSRVVPLRLRATGTSQAIALGNVYTSGTNNARVDMSIRTLEVKSNRTLGTRTQPSYTETITVSGVTKNISSLATNAEKRYAILTNLANDKVNFFKKSNLKLKTFSVSSNEDLISDCGETFDGNLGDESNGELSTCFPKIGSTTNTNSYDRGLSVAGISCTGTGSTYCNIQGAYFQSYTSIIEIRSQIAGIFRRSNKTYYYPDNPTFTARYLKLEH